MIFQTYIPTDLIPHDYHKPPIWFIFDNQCMYNTIMDHTSLPKKDFQKMVFLYNTIENGWTVRKYKDAYIFTKKHENRKEIFQSDYLEKFIETNRSIE
jgi:hypothetical protein